MATTKPIISVVFDEDTLQRIEDFQFKNRLGSRSKAVNQLVLLGLAEWMSSRDIEEEEIDIDPLEEAQFLLSTLNDLIVKIKKEKGD